MSRFLIGEARVVLTVVLTVLIVVNAGCTPDQSVAAPGTAAKAAAKGTSQQPPVASSTVSAATPEATGKARKFQFHFRFDVAGFEPGELVRMWLPVPPSNDDQTATPLPHQLPAAPTFHEEPKYGNRILYLEAPVPKNGTLHIDVPYEITRREIRTSSVNNENDVVTDIDPLQRKLFLQPNVNVPVGGKPLDLLRGLALSDNKYQLANQIFDVVDDHVAYNKEGLGWGNGDVLWVCASGRGNCTDFHSLFISLARSQDIPSRFEIGFPIPNDARRGAIGGYHCWAFFFLRDRGWIPVDISEADKHPAMREYYFGSLTADRVTFSVGRDITLVPKSAQGPLNYFVYPHVEVGGTTASRAQIQLQFSYDDV